MVTDPLLCCCSGLNCSAFGASVLVASTFTDDVSSFACARSQVSGKNAATSATAISLIATNLIVISLGWHISSILPENAVFSFCKETDNVTRHARKMFKTAQLLVPTPLAPGHCFSSDDKASTFQRSAALCMTS